MQTTHPETEELAHYLETPEIGNHINVRRHLLNCQVCRNKLDKLVKLELAVKHHASRISNTISIAQSEQQLIEQLTDGSLDAESAQKAREQIGNSPELMKSALHYMVHSASMSRNLKIAENNSINTTLSRGGDRKPGLIFSAFRRIKYLFEFPVPVWAMAPAAFIIALTVSFVYLHNNEQAASGEYLAVFQDDMTLGYKREGIPAGSIGFFHDAQTSSQPFSGMSIELAEGTLHFDWKPIENANEYRLSVFSLDSAGSKEIASKTVNHPGVDFAGLELGNQSHYKWQLSGNTGNGLTFETTGDFIYIKTR